MTGRDALLEAICLNPDEDTPRLMYADELDRLNAIGVGQLLDYLNDRDSAEGATS